MESRATRLWSDITPRSTIDRPMVGVVSVRQLPTLRVLRGDRASETHGVPNSSPHTCAICAGCAVKLTTDFPTARKWHLGEVKRDSKLSEWAGRPIPGGLRPCREGWVSLQTAKSPCVITTA